MSDSEDLSRNGSRASAQECQVTSRTSSVPSEDGFEPAERSVIKTHPQFDPGVREEPLRPKQRLVVKVSRRFVFLDSAELDWIEASGNYVKLHVGTECFTVRSGIGRIAEKLDPREFVRIHRSIIINISRIKALEPCDNGEYIVALKDGKHLSCSRGYCGGLQELIKNGYPL